MMAAMNFTVPGPNDEDHSHLHRLQPVCVPKLRPDYLAQFNETEFEVAEILVNFPYYASKCLYDFCVGPFWGSKRRRSAENNLHSPCRKVVSSTPPPVDSAPKAEATSPSTPLAFCPSDTSEPPKSKRSTKSTNKKICFKRKRAELQKIVEEKLQTQQTLVKEIEKVKLHLQTLHEENSKLKAKKLKLIGSTGDVRTEKPRLETECPQPQLQLQHTAVNDYVLAGLSTSTLHQHQAPPIPHPVINPTVHYLQPRGPLEFDLNIPAEEMVAMKPAVLLQPLDHRYHHHQIVMNRSYAEQARANRQYRIQQNKSKKAQRGGC